LSVSTKSSQQTIVFLCKQNTFDVVKEVVVIPFKSQKIFS